MRYFLEVEPDSALINYHIEFALCEMGNEILKFRYNIDGDYNMGACYRKAVYLRSRRGRLPGTR
jgi:hypothetical protein